MGLYAGHPGLQQFRALQHAVAAAPARAAAAPPPVNYTVAYNVNSQRILCKTCRNPIASNTLKVGYRDRNQMRWFHLGCLPHDLWQQASMPGRLAGLPDLPAAQQVMNMLVTTRAAL